MLNTHSSGWRRWAPANPQKQGTCVVEIALTISGPVTHDFFSLTKMEEQYLCLDKEMHSTWRSLIVKKKSLKGTSGSHQHILWSKEGSRTPILFQGDGFYSALGQRLPRGPKSYSHSRMAVQPKPACGTWKWITENSLVNLKMHATASDSDRKDKKLLLCRKIL